jgi:hypothetical protein
LCASPRQRLCFRERDGILWHASSVVAADSTRLISASSTSPFIHSCRRSFLGPMTHRTKGDYTRRPFLSQRPTPTPRQRCSSRATCITPTSTPTAQCVSAIACVRTCACARVVGWFGGWLGGWVAAYCCDESVVPEWTTRQPNEGTNVALLLSRHQREPCNIQIRSHTRTTPCTHDRRHFDPAHCSRRPDGVRASERAMEPRAVCGEGLAVGHLDACRAQRRESSKC